MVAGGVTTTRSLEQIRATVVLMVEGPRREPTADGER
jgi:hypothetical protein